MKISMALRDKIIILGPAVPKSEIYLVFQRYVAQRSPISTADKIQPPLVLPSNLQRMLDRYLASKDGLRFDSPFECEIHTIK